MTITHRQYQIHEIAKRFEINTYDNTIKTCRCFYCGIGERLTPMQAYKNGWRVIGSYDSTFQPVLVCPVHAKDGKETKEIKP